jgi:NAD(P)-dependent dehydrogenase (short-subunit alcohol dehydrogenase family)
MSEELRKGEEQKPSQSASQRIAIVTGASRRQGIGAGWGPHLFRPLEFLRSENALASEEAGWITGQIIHSTGGF